jgi:hypothetical protein
MPFNVITRRLGVAFGFGLALPVVDLLAWRVVVAMFDSEWLVTRRRGCGRWHVAFAAAQPEKTLFRNKRRSTDVGNAYVDA